MADQSKVSPDCAGWDRLGWSGDRLAGTALLKVGAAIPLCLKLGAALYTERTDGGGEYGDDEINDGFPVYFHILLLILMFNNRLINLKKGQDEQVPVHDGVSFLFADVSLGCHRNTPDCILPCLQKLSNAIKCLQNRYRQFQNLFRNRFLHRFRYHHRLG